MSSWFGRSSSSSSPAPAAGPTGAGAAEAAPPMPPSFEVDARALGGMPLRTPGIQMVMNEVKVMTNLCNRMADVCFEKCITKFNSGELHIGELACDDRCAIKYMEASTLVSEVMRKSSQQVQQAAGAGASA